MTSYDREYRQLESYSAEKTNQSIIPHKIPTLSVAGIIGNLTQIVTVLAKNGKVDDDLRKRIGQLSVHERKVMPEFLLRLADFYHSVAEYSARGRVLDLVEFLESEFGIPVQMYETSIN